MRRTSRSNRPAGNTRRLTFENLDARTLCAVDLTPIDYGPSAEFLAAEAAATQLAMTLDASAAYVSLAAAVNISPSAALATDATSFDGAVLNVRMGAGGTPTDVLAIRHTGHGDGQIGLNHTAVAYEGFPIGTFQIHGPIRGAKHVYKVVDGRELLLHVVSPQNTDPNRPAIVLFHGGGWRQGTPASLNHQAQYFASRGMVAILAEYRFVDPFGNEAPADSVRDAKSAIRWVRANAATLGVDPNRIAAGGYSAGGHLAAFTGMVDGMNDPADDLGVSAKANALVLLSPTINNGPGQYGYSRVGSNFAAYSPAHNVSADDPPTIAFIGSEDIHIPEAVVIDVTDRLSDLGVQAQTVVLESLGHEATVYRWNNPAYYEVLRQADQFLASLGWLEGESTLEMPTRRPAADRNEIRQLTITLGSKATPAAVEELLQSLTFRSSSTPATTPRVDVTLTDGHGLVATGQTRIVRPTETVTWTKGEDPVLVFRTSDLPDADATSFDGARLVVRTGNGAEVADRLGIRSLANLSAANGEIRFFGNLMGTYAGGGGTAPLVVRFNENATAFHVERVLWNIAFRNASPTVQNGSRATFAEIYRGNNSLALQEFRTVQVSVPVNAAPVISPTSGGTVNYIRGGNAVALLPTATVADPDTAIFEGGKLTVQATSGANAANRLILRGSYSIEGTNVLYKETVIGTLTSDGVGENPLEITFNAAAKRAIVELLVRFVYFRTAGGISTDTRVFAITLTDGDGGTSNTVTTTVNVT